MLRPGVRTRAHRETSSAVYYVVEGTGSTTVGATQFDWGPGDFVVVPPRAAHSHANRSSATPAVLFSVQDVPLLQYLNLYRVEEV
jgi:gentisate 1,2-dioxygenase